MEIRRLAAAAVLLGAFAAGARAEDPVPLPKAPAAPPAPAPAKKEKGKDAARDSEVPDLEVVATGFGEDRKQSTLPLFVLDGSWFEEHQVSSVADGLRQVPGVTVSRGGTPGAASSLFLRGAASNQVLVLQDGMPLNDPTLGSQFNFFDLDALNLDRIEVLRGSYGALYGSSAIGGVVNLVSRRGEGPGTFEAAAEGGSFLSHRETLSGRGGDERSDWSCGLAETGTDGPHDRQAFESRSFAGLFGATVAGDGRAELAVRRIDSSAQDPYDFGNPLPKDPNISRQRDLTAIGLSVEKPLGATFTAKVRASVTKADSTFRNGNDTNPAGKPEFESTSQATTTFVGGSVKASLADDAKARRELSFVAGGDAKEEQSLGFSDSSFGGGLGLDRSTRNEGAYLLGRGRFGAFSANGGGRFDEHSQAGREWSPQAGVRADVDATATVLRANYGEGFRAATPSEFTDPFVGNPNLGPERSRSIDAGVEQRIAEKVTAEATVFRLRTQDLIAYDPVSGKLQNLDRTQCEGIECGLDADAGRGLLLRASFTRQRPRNEATMARLPNRPDAFATAGADWTRGQWTLTADLYWQSSVDDLGQKGPDQGLRDSAGRRLVANVGGRWKMSDSVTLFARIENLTNARYVETPSAPRGLPITFTAGVTLGF